MSLDVVTRTRIIKLHFLYDWYSSICTHVWLCITSRVQTNVEQQNFISNHFYCKLLSIRKYTVIYGVRRRTLFKLTVCRLWNSIRASSLFSTFLFSETLKLPYSAAPLVFSLWVFVRKVRCWICNDRRDAKNTMVLREFLAKEIRVVISPPVTSLLALVNYMYRKCMCIIYR